MKSSERVGVKEAKRRVKCVLGGRKAYAKAHGRTEHGWYKALKEGSLGISLAVQWLSAGGVGSISSWGAKILHASPLKKQNGNNIVTNSIKTLKNGPHQKKKKKNLVKHHSGFKVESRGLGLRGNAGR